MTTVGIIGASGYTGIELVRILGCHPNVTIAYATSRTHAGKRISALAPDLRGICDIELIEVPPTETVDVVFLAVPHGAARQVLNQHRHLHHSLIIDLSSDHRAHREWTYGLPELYSEQFAVLGGSLIQVALRRHYSLHSFPWHRAIGSPTASTQAASLALRVQVWT